MLGADGDFKRPDPHDGGNHLPVLWAQAKMKKERTGVVQRGCREAQRVTASGESFSLSDANVAARTLINLLLFYVFLQSRPFSPPIHSSSPPPIAPLARAESTSSISSTNSLSAATTPTVGKNSQRCCAFPFPTSPRA